MNSIQQIIFSFVLEIFIPYRFSLSELILKVNEHNMLYRNFKWIHYYYMVQDTQINKIFSGDQSRQ
jgi:hypothetical protein